MNWKQVSTTKHRHTECHLPLESDHQPTVCHLGLLPLLHKLHGSLWHPVGRRQRHEPCFPNSPKLATMTHPTLPTSSTVKNSALQVRRSKTVTQIFHIFSIWDKKVTPVIKNWYKGTKDFVPHFRAVLSRASSIIFMHWHQQHVNSVWTVVLI